MPHPALDSLHPAVRAWFASAYGSPSPPQALGWPAIAAGRNVLILAPTGSGKTLAAFLQCISAVYEEAAAGGKTRSGVRVLYISPLKALNNDIHRNLELPLAGIAAEAQKLDLTVPPLRAAIRTGDTTAAERRRILSDPPEILITTPESLFLMLSSKAREILRGVAYVIVDEIHSLFPNKRGVHLALTLEHLAAVVGRDFQRIGLSATQRPLDGIAAFLGGGGIEAGGAWRPRPVEILDTGQRKELDLRLILPLEDLRALEEKTIWPSIYRQLLELVRAHRSTLIFVNNRALAERVTANLNDLAGTAVARTHHGSIAKEQRLEVEDLLKSGRLPCLVATSSLELGIDVGAIDLVIQVESPKEIARGLQRVGRAGHLVGLPSKGRIIPKTRGDLLECAAIAREMRRGLVEEARAPENCLDVLAQQLVSLVCVEERGADELFRLVRGARSYRDLPRSQFDAILSLLAGEADPHGERFLELKPRIFWDRVNDRVRAADGGRRLVYTSGGVIPDRGYFGVYLSGGGVRLGELDEEFVAERRLGDRFVLGTSSWRIEKLRRDRVIVTPARRGQATVPFWKGEGLGRPYELGKRFGGFLAELEDRLDQEDFEAWVGAECLADEAAARNLRAYLAAQIGVAGALPTHKRIVIEEFQDELGEWRLLLHSPFGSRIHAPLALLLRERFKTGSGLEVETMHDDNGILMVCPGGARPPRLDLRDLPLEDLPGALAEIVRGSTLFARLFRENAARALLLPRAPYGRKRTPLWLARVRAGDLLQVVSDQPDFPLVLETIRECLSEVFDLGGLAEVLAGIRAGGIAVHHVSSRAPSPFSQALQFKFYGTYMYLPDMPKGELKFRALGLNRQALKELLGAQGLRELLDPEAIATVGAEAAGTAEGFRPRNADELHAWLRHGRELTPQPPLFCEREGEEGFITKSLLEVLKVDGRVALLSWPAAGGTREAWTAAEDAPLYLAALRGCHVSRPKDFWPILPQAEAPLDQDEAMRRLVRRFTKTRGPFTLADLSSHYGLPPDEALALLTALEEEGLIQSGEFTPGLTEVEWCDVDLLQRIHRRSLARARREIEPRGAAGYAAFLARWQGAGGGGKGSETLSEALNKLSGLFLPHSAWEGGVLPLRVGDFRPGMLERLVAAGRFVWAARGTGEEMRVGFLGEHNPPAPFPTREGGVPPRLEPGSSPPDPLGAYPLSAPERGPSLLCEALAKQRGEVNLPSGPARAVWDLLSSRGALFLDRIVQGTGLAPAAALEALEALMALGLVTNDTLGPLRYFGARRPESQRYHLTQADLNAMGRWSLLEPGPELTPEAIAEILLQRYGLVTKDHFQRDFPPSDPGIATFDFRPSTFDSSLPTHDPRPATRDWGPGTGDFSWADILGVFDRWEAVGKVRRGYFVEGLGGLQYALPEAVEMLRQPVEEGLPEFWAILKVDPANPYGSLLPMPETDLQSEILVLRRGLPVLAAGGKKVRLARLDEELRGEALKEALKAWAGLAGWRGGSKIAVAEFAGRPVGETEAAEILKGLGFERGYKEMVRWLG